MQTPVTFELGGFLGDTQYRAGSSNNYGTQANTEPDFLFELAQNPDFEAPLLNGQSITTSGAVTSTTVSVTSRDYGGVTLLRAKAKIGDDWVYGASPATYDLDYNQLPPATCAGDLTATPFVQIPIDVNCNWIADFWERKYFTSGNISHLVDDEVFSQQLGNPLTIPNGDSFSAYDEYRGFHTMSVTNPSEAVHVRTDPTKITLFFADGSPDRHFSAPVRSGIGVSLDGVTELYELKSDQYLERGYDSNLLLPKIGKLNKNGNERGNSSLVNFPIFIKPGDTSSASTDACRTSGVLGITSAGMNQYGILVCESRIQLCTATDLQQWREQILGHEIGHKLYLDHYRENRSHYVASGSPAALAEGQISVLSATEYAEDSANSARLFLSSSYFGLSSTDIIRLERPREDFLGLTGISVNDSSVFVKLSYPATPLAGQNPGVLRFNLDKSLTSAGSAYQSDIAIDKFLDKKYMNWGHACVTGPGPGGHFSFSTAVPFDMLLMSARTNGDPQ